MSNGMGNPGSDPMEPQVEPQVNDVPISVDAFINRLQQRYGKMVAELMQENAELGAGIGALRESNAEFRDRATGLEAAFRQQQDAIDSLIGAIGEKDARIAELERTLASQPAVAVQPGIAD